MRSLRVGYKTRSHLPVMRRVAWMWELLPACRERHGSELMFFPEKHAGSVRPEHGFIKHLVGGTHSQGIKISRPQGSSSGLITLLARSLALSISIAYHTTSNKHATRSKARAPGHFLPLGAAINLHPSSSPLSSSWRQRIIVNSMYTCDLSVGPVKKCKTQKDVEAGEFCPACRNACTYSTKPVVFA